MTSTHSSPADIYCSMYKIVATIFIEDPQNIEKTTQRLAFHIFGGQGNVSTKECKREKGQLMFKLTPGAMLVYLLSAVRCILIPQ